VDALDGVACKVRYYSLTLIVRSFAASGLRCGSAWLLAAICRR
jgi:hypothetical protein